MPSDPKAETLKLPSDVFGQVIGVVCIVVLRREDSFNSKLDRAVHELVFASTTVNVYTPAGPEIFGEVLPSCHW